MAGIIAKQSEAQISQSRYELFEDVDVVLKNGSSGTIEKSLGIYTIENLKAQKDNLQAQIDAIQIKIDAINLLEG